MATNTGYIKSVGSAMLCELCSESIVIEGPVDIHGNVTFACPHCGHEIVATVRLGGWKWASNCPVSG